MAEQIVAEELTADILRSELSYDPETGEFRRLKTRGKWKAGEVAGCLSEGYIKIRVNGGKQYFAHRLAWLFVYGEWPSLFIDHRNRVKSDNRLQNLRDVDKSGNGRNRGELSNNVSGISGVHWLKRNKCWIAYATKNGKRFYLGSFENKEKAVRTREEWWAQYPIESAQMRYGNQAYH